MKVSDKMLREGVKALLEIDEQELLEIWPSRLSTYERIVTKVWQAMHTQEYKDWQQGYIVKKPPGSSTE